MFKVADFPQTDEAPDKRYYRSEADMAEVLNGDSRRATEPTAGKPAESFAPRPFVQSTEPTKRPKEGRELPSGAPLRG